MRIIPILTAMALVACAAAPSSEGSAKQESQQTEGNGTTSGSTSKTGGSSSGGSSSAGTNNGGTGANACAAETTFDDCEECCEDKDATVTARGKEISKAWQKCACAASACGSVCANDYCKATDPDADAEDDACDECLDSEAKVGACDDAEDDAWDKLEADAVYAGVTACMKAAQCDAMPEDD
jgi:hypothetical protein